VSYTSLYYVYNLLLLLNDKVIEFIIHI
jgi:hypothetical protein